MNQMFYQNRKNYFKYLFSTFLLLSLSWSVAFATECDDLQVINTNTAISISNITTPKAIIKLFDANWDQLEECNDNCGNEIEYTNLNAGDYHVQVQLFDDDWNGICNQTFDLFLDGCLCPAVYQPVCGVDGKTYGNACEAGCAGVEIITEGECEPCVCDAEYAPVCGIDGKTYSNRCMAECAGVDIIVEGECTPITTCDLLSKITFNTDLCSQCLSEIAVYELDGKSYLVYLGDNEHCSDAATRVVDCDTGDELCLIGGIGGFTCDGFLDKAEKKETVLKDDCSPCICTTEYAPVCGVDGKTYGNRCEADCAGVDIIAEGECTPTTTCDLLSKITLNTDLCSQCLSEIAVYSYNEKSYLVYIGDHIICADVPNTVIDCDTGEPFCNDGGGELPSTCGNFFSVAEKIETILKDDCTPCICTKEYVPVCGVDGKTYGNRCEADCAGVDIIAEGECPCICPAVALPVCGIDGKTYINACKAACAGVEVAFDGSCEECIGTPPEGVACLQVYEPVCGCNGITYSNDCEATNAGVKSWTTGVCPDPEDCFGPPNPLIKCDSEYIPVCGCDGETYQNSCTADQNGILSWTEGPCVIDCACPENYDPVCGVDGRTYGNECEAKCAGVEIANEGECNNNGECDLLALIDFTDDLCGSCITEIAIYSYRGKNYLVQLGDFINCPDAVNTVISCALEGGTFCEEGGINTGTPCGDFFEVAIKISTILKDECEDDCQGLPTPGTPCEEVYEPVCACNGKTYDNQCMAQNLGLKSWSEGACSMTTIECGEISLAYDSERIIMKGKPDANYFFKVHDVNKDYHEIFNCSDNCGSEQTAFLPLGEYVVKIYDTEWSLICEQAIKLQLAPTPESEDTDTANQFRCEDVVVTYKDGTVKLVGNNQKNYHLKIIDNRYRDVFACMWECGSSITAENIPTGAYLIRVLDGEYNILCEKSILLTNSLSIIRTTTDIKVAAYPNPASETFFMKIKSNNLGVGTLQVINAYGQVLTTQSIDNQSNETIQLDVRAYQNGLYYYQIKLPKQQILSGKFLVNRMY